MADSGEEKDAIEKVLTELIVKANSGLDDHEKSGFVGMHLYPHKQNQEVQDRGGACSIFGPVQVVIGIYLFCVGIYFVLWSGACASIMLICLE